MYPIQDLRNEVLAHFRPPPPVKLSKWIEENLILWDGPSVGRKFRLWPPQRGIADAMGDSAYPRVSVIKASRVGYTKLLIGAIAAKAVRSPAPAILLVPTDGDARGFAVDEVEPAFEAAEITRGVIHSGRIDGRNTLTVKRGAGGWSLKILPARAPRNLRRHDARDLYIDEEDGMEVTVEGDPIALAEKRTLAHADRKIIRGSTPTGDLTSTIVKAYNESDQRVYEVPCPHCGAAFEILWPHIVWPKGEPEKAVCVCPHCLAAANAERPLGKNIFNDRPAIIIPERYKTEMVAAGDWVAQRPDIQDHAGFRLNTFISQLPNARWSKLAAEFEKAKRAGLAELQVFANQVEGRVWKTSLDEIDETGLAARVEDFGIAPGPNGENRFPRDVLLVAAGVDTQDDRFEIKLWGFSETQRFDLAHDVIWGDPADSVTQAELDTYLRTTWQHPNGWTIGIEICAIDSQGHKTQAVYDFCKPRLGRRIYPIISRVGARRLWEPAKKRQDGTRLFIVGHDQAKTAVLQGLVIPELDDQGEPSVGRCRFSSDLPTDTFAQLTGEKRVIRYVRNRAVHEFRPTNKGQRVEALDATCYCWAAVSSLRINFAERRARRAGEKQPRPSVGDLSKLLNK